MMKPVFLLKSKSVVGEKVQHHDQTKQDKQSKRKIVQQTNVEEQVSKIAKIFGNRGKQLLEMCWSSLGFRLLNQVYNLRHLN